MEDASLSRRWSHVKDDVSSRSASHAQDEEDEEALKWAALEKLPTLNRMRTAILRKVRADGSTVLEEVDVAKLGLQDHRQIIGRILGVVEEDNARLLFKLRSRLERVGIELPKVEVRFQNLEVHADVHRGSRAITSIPNSFINTVQTILAHLHILPSRKESISILQNISGIVKPSRLTLLLGPPGSGKSTLLLALVNKLDPNLRVTGDVTYNGHNFHEFVPQRTSAYISQHDLHMWELTVRETLNFSARCQGVGSRYEMLAELSRREKTAGIKPDPDLDAFLKATAVEGQKANIMTDYIIQILGLDICADIMVGNALKRGISGGQKKRVTTGEILVGPAKVLFMDEISTGLDSSTTFQIVKCLQQTVQALEETMLISLLQPAPETFELFDDLILLSEGHVVYQGPRDMVLDFFETQGFKCPERKGVADFLQEVTSRKDQAKFRIDAREAYQFVTVKEFAAAFQRYHVGQHIAQELAKPFMKSECHPAALITKKYTLSSWELLKACTSREVILMKRNLLVYGVNIAQGTFLAFVVTTLFLRTTMHQRNVQDGNKYMGALFYSLINIMFRGIAEMTLTVGRLPAFYKQRDLLFYPSWAWALPAILLKIPLSALEAGVWIGITYWGVGFAPEASRCFRQYFILFMLNQAALALFRCIAAISRMLTLTGTLGFLILIIMVVNGGFLKSRENIQPWWIWSYWISPLQYGQNAIAVNEFLADRWQKPLAGTSDTIGKALLKARGIFPHEYWYWIGIGGLAGCIVLFNTIYILALTFLNPLGEVQSTLVSEEHPKDDSADKIAKEMQPAITENGGMTPRRGMGLPFEPLSIAFNHISYYVDVPPEMRQQGMADERLQLLRNVSGAFRPGVLTALIGVSGAGKTTLMDVLAGRKTGGYIEGSINISGYPKKQDSFARVSGYCEQTDIHSPNVTVHESLVFSAWLRLAKTIDKKTRMMFVEEVMDLVELTPLRNASVGLPGVSGLSTEQRKRLTIAVELVANPSIMFMDEPTSGLDARAAAIVMRAVRNTLDTGRTVVCTIHQPSIDIFESFDELLLMKRGGQLIYAGPLGRRSCHMIEYFQAIPGIPSIKDGYNPSTWALEVTSQSVEQKLGIDFAKIYEESVLYQQNQARIKEISTPAPESHDLHFPTKYSLPLLEQCLACIWKQHCSHWRNPVYFYSRMFDGVVLGFLLATMFWNTGSKRENQQDIFNLLGAMYTSVLFLGFNNSGAVQQLVAVERIIFYREKAAGMYSALPYALAQVLVKVPYVFLQAWTYGILTYLIMNLEWTAAKFFYFIFFMSSTFLYYTLFGMLTAALTPTLQLGTILSVCVYAFWNIFSGLLVPLPKMPPWWKWNYWASPAAWTLYGIITSQLGDVETTMKIPDQPPARIKDFINNYFGFRHNFLPVVALMHIVFPVLYALLFAACISHLRFQRR